MRKSPIKHKVRAYRKSTQKVVHNYLRGAGTISVKLANPALSIPSIKLPKNIFSPSDIKVGDYVDFGSYGKLYVNQISEGSWRVTDIESDRSNPDASGWYIDKDYATGIIEKFTDKEPQHETKLDKNREEEANEAWGHGYGGGDYSDPYTHDITGISRRK